MWPLRSSRATANGPPRRFTSTSTLPDVTTTEPTTAPPMPASAGSSSCGLVHATAPVSALTAFTNPSAPPAKTQPSTTIGVPLSPVTPGRAPVLTDGAAGLTTCTDHAGASVATAAVSSVCSSGWLRVLARSCPYVGQSPPAAGAAQPGTARAAGFAADPAKAGAALT